MISVKRERCPKCGSPRLINNICVEKGQPIRVYLQCSKCDSFVARYTLESYTSNESYESLLKYLSKSCADSGRSISQRLKSFDKCIEKEFEKCKKLVEERETEKRIEEIIHEKEDNE